MNLKLRNRVSREVEIANTQLSDLRETLSANEPANDDREQCHHQLDLIIEHLEIARARLKDDLAERPSP